MTSTLRPRLVNGRFGDPAVFVEVAHERHALPLDLGDLSSLSARDLLRVRAVGVSHMHMDHMIGFDALLRVNVGRQAVIDLVGPAGLAGCVGSKLSGYTWDLVDRYTTDLVFVVHEVAPERLPKLAFASRAGLPQTRRPIGGRLPGSARAPTSCSSRRASLRPMRIGRRQERI